MFEASVYTQRRQTLKSQIKSGIVVLPGNHESPMNYTDNCYPFVQDSTFRYYFGLNLPGLAAILDLDAGSEILFGEEPTMATTVWTGPQPAMAEQAAKAGLRETGPISQFRETIKKAAQAGRQVHFAPQYRADNAILLAELLGKSPTKLNEAASEELIKAIVTQRSVKSAAELAQIEEALDICYDMHTYAMQHTSPGLVERQIAGAMEGISMTRGGMLAYPVIFTVNGQTLHNHYYGNTMQAGQIVVNDSGASNAMGYAGDITRTIPVSGQFDARQKEIYNLVLQALTSSIEQVKPQAKFRDVHLHASKIIASGLHDLGIMRGSVEEAVAAGAHALFFPHGLGHMMGLDVHDMENLGEDYVGYDDETQRSSQFGLAALRLGRRVQPGFVFTVEPGIYFIPELIDQWQAEKKHAEFINYTKVNEYRNFGGIRIEENVVVTNNAGRVLGKAIPRTVDEVQTMCG